MEERRSGEPLQNFTTAHFKGVGLQGGKNQVPSVDL